MSGVAPNSPLRRLRSFGVTGLFAAALATTGCGTLLGFDQDYKSSGAGGNAGGSGSGASSQGGSGTAGTTGTAGSPAGGSGAGGSATGTGGSSTSTGTGGAAKCTDASECDPGPNPCMVPTCPSGLCDYVPVQSGSAIADQIEGDCRTLVCDGAGAVVAADNAADVPVDVEPCHVGSCSGAEPQFDNAPLGSFCNVNGGTKCNASGECVQCNANADCATGVCAAQICLTGSCADGVKNNNETDIDCGGDCGATCLVGDDCGNAGDCASNNCAGGACALKANGQSCGQAANCQSGLCVEGVCCDGQCSGPCDSCTVPGSVGTCSNVPVGMPGDCAGSVCNSLGVCGVCQPFQDLGMCCVPCENPAAPPGDGAKADGSDSLPPPSPGDCCTPQFCTAEGDYPPCP